MTTEKWPRDARWIEDWLRPRAHVAVAVRRQMSNRVCRFEDLTVVDVKISIFRDITSCSPLKVNWSFGGSCCLHLQFRRISHVRNQREAGGKLLITAFMLVFCLVYFSTLKAEVICSETSVDFQWTKRRYIPEDSTFHSLTATIRTAAVRPVTLLSACCHSYKVVLKLSSIDTGHGSESFVINRNVN
jgi:hypothetical protein